MKFIRLSISIRTTTSTIVDSSEQKLELENEFCRNFACCGLELENLHELLEHYEEYHLSFVHEDPNIEFHTSPNPFKKNDMVTCHNAPPLLTKEHITNTDLTMLENANTLSLDENVETVDSILEGLSTPSLSPSTSIQTLDEDLIAHSKSKDWYQKVNAIIMESMANEGRLWL
jgi:hypothetical protein